ERGVEDFTLACGTGAVAAAVYWGVLRKVEKIKVNMPGGLLQVNLDPIFSLGQFNFQTNLKSPLLIGEAKLIGQVVIKL
ncbi:MAG: hypothetical protein KDD45_01135, partial [Bdellovibrionales bacterium]|nr:hypothetical protein [Bdellovibrionales bacterium]